MYMSDGWYARFVWPDWPQPQAKEIAGQVEQFHQAHPELRPVRQGSKEWVLVSHGWESDYKSAEAIATAFSKSYANRLKWVESEKDNRGQIAAGCSVEGAGEFLFQLYWKSSSIQPLGSLNEEDRNAFRIASTEVLNWAGSRIQPILDTLRQKLHEIYGDRFRGLYVFGSYARPDAGIELPADSDLDVALILKDFENPFEERTRLSDITADLSLEHAIVISLIPIREEDYREGKTNFTRVISKYAIPA